MKELKIMLEDKDFRKLRNCKESAKINKECENWADYILKLAKVRKEVKK